MGAGGRGGGAQVEALVFWVMFSSLHGLCWAAHVIVYVVFESAILKAPILGDIWVGYSASVDHTHAMIYAGLFRRINCKNGLLDKL